MGERECHWNDLWEAALHPSEDGVCPDSSLGGDGRTGRAGGSRRDLTHGPARVGTVVVGLGLGDVLPVRQ